MAALKLVIQWFYSLESLVVKFVILSFDGNQPVNHEDYYQQNDAENYVNCLHAIFRNGFLNQDKILYYIQCDASILGVIVKLVGFFVVIVQLI